MNAVNEATEEAQDGDLEGVLDALEGLIAKTGKKHKWFSDDAAEELQTILEGILDCLGEHNGDVDTDDNGNGNGPRHNNGNGNANGHGNGNGNNNGQPNGNANGHWNGNGNKPGNGPKK